MNERQAYASIRNAIRLENLSESIAAPVGKQLRVIFDELKQQFRNMPPGNIERELWYRQQRLRILDMVTPLSRSAGADMAAAMDEEVYKQMEYAQDMLDSVDETAILAPQNAVSALGSRPTSKVEFTRQQLHTIAEDTTVLGDKLGDLFRPDLDDHGRHGKWIEQNIDLIDKKVKTGFLTGQTNEQIAAELPGLGRQAVSRNKAIARTAVMDMSARSQEALWMANSDRIKGWEYDATLDNRVCDRCAPWDGTTKTVRGQLPSLPLHVNCRCRVLPLTATELALREKEGPQRRSVVELVDAKTKEGALAKVKVQKNVVGARAYAKQVKVDGKKYWRVAKDIKQADHPLTMAEFLQQASPATQKQVLGSAKRRSKFMKLIAGSENRPPITPERALKEVVEWKPTVTRRPRVSMEMKLEISKLKSQKELMAKNSEGDNHVVYGYIRKKDTRYGKAGSLYYVGIADDGGKRPYVKHRSGLHGVPVPKDKRQVRQLAVTKTRAEAERIEIALIAREGRIPVKGKAGVGTTGRRGLLNKSLGGGKGNLGSKMPKELALRIERTKAEKAAKKFGITADEWMRLGTKEKSSVYHRYRTGRRGKELLVSSEKLTDPRLEAAAKKYGTSTEEWAKLSAKERGKVSDRYADGMRGKDLFKKESLHGKQALKESAEKYGMSLESWSSLSDKERQKINVRYGRGVRGKDLFADELASSNNAKIALAAKKHGVSVEVWSALTPKIKQQVKSRYNRGKRGADLWKGIL